MLWQFPSRINNMSKTVNVNLANTNCRKEIDFKLEINKLTMQKRSAESEKRCNSNDLFGIQVSYNFVKLQEL